MSDSALGWVGWIGARWLGPLYEYNMRKGRSGMGLGVEVESGLVWYTGMRYA